MDQYRKHFAERLRLALKGTGKNQAWLAQEMGTTSATVSRWVNGHDFPSGRENELARILGITVEDLLGAPARQRLSSVMALQTLEDRVRLSQEDAAAVLPTILAKAPTERALILYMIFQEDRFLETIPRELRRMLALLLKSDPEIP